MKKFIILLFINAVVISAGTQSDKENYIERLNNLLEREISLWYPLCVDTLYGGYYSDINYKWELEGAQNKMIVTQARHIWSISNAALNFPKYRECLKYAKHGVDFLSSVMWDDKYGGFYDLVDRKGKPIKENGKIIKKAYGNAFAIYGLSAYFRATGDSSALNLAIKTFEWLDRHSYDEQYGGYFQFMERNGAPFTEGYNEVPPKDQNSSIHLLETFTELYKVWKDDHLRRRLESVFYLVRDRIVSEKGYMRLFFTRDMEPISYRDSSDLVRSRNFEFDHVSFGHDIEVAYLLLEASDAMDLPDKEKTLGIAKKLVDHTLLNGWDSDKGGIYDRGYYFKGKDKITIIRKTKEWWAQAEALNSALLFAILFPVDNIDYYSYFEKQINYIENYLVDGKYGGWFFWGSDSAENMEFYPKASIWKGNYHTTRALINCLNHLEKDLK